MKILYVALKYNYGQPSQGYSYEHYNFYHALVHMGHDILYFDMMLMQHGRDTMNQRLLEIARREKPDLMFTVLHTTELDQSVVREISNSDTITLNWFCDDQWRWDDYSRFWAPCFNWVTTTAPSALPKYARLGYSGVIKSQWACNHFLYRKLDLPLKYDITFVGQPHGNRREIIQSLRDVGINVRAWGHGWESGRLSQEEMIRVFNQSRINLNLSKSSTSNRSTHDDQNPEQIKGRSFEIPGCGGFQLSGSAEDLDNYYESGKEIVCFEGVDDLKEKACYYLSNEKERAAIAQAGYQRTLNGHTYAHRFASVFKRLGLPSEPLHEVLRGDVDLGQTMEFSKRIIEKGYLDRKLHELERERNKYQFIY